MEVAKVLVTVATDRQNPTNKSPIKAKREPFSMNRLAVYSYLTRYPSRHTGSGRLFTGCSQHLRELC